MKMMTVYVSKHGDTSPPVRTKNGERVEVVGADMDGVGPYGSGLRVGDLLEFWGDAQEVLDLSGEWCVVEVDDLCHSLASGRVRPGVDVHMSYGEVKVRRYCPDRYLDGVPSSGYGQP